MTEHMAAHNLADEADNLLKTVAKRLRYLNTHGQM